MAKVIGIDLGTTNSVTTCEEGGEARILLNRANERGTPSVVGLHRKTGELLVGSMAVDHSGLNPENTIFSIKRLMGAFYDDLHVQDMVQQAKYRIVKAEDGDDVRVMLADEVHTPTEVSAMILQRLKEDAEARLGEEVSHAVITVPAYFSLQQRVATRDAGEKAGLQVKTILDEPSAAAIAFGVDRNQEDPQNVLVYDLGGGTFDISILFIAGEMFSQMAIEGDRWLGGDDFDRGIVNYILKQVQDEHGVDLSDNTRVMVLLRRAAEKAKRELSEMTSTSIVQMGVVPLPDGDMEDIDVDLTRAEFEDLPISDGMVRIEIKEEEEDDFRQWCEDLKLNASIEAGVLEFGPDTVRNRLKKTILLSRKALQESGLTGEDVDHVVLVGGSTTLPLVQQMLEEEFGAKKMSRDVDPMGCVALGAGIAAARIPGIICICGHENALEVTACGKCGADLGGANITIACPNCGRDNDPEEAKCSACGGPLKVSVMRVTAHPVGILSHGENYEVLVPKNPPYPTPEPFVSRFHTASGSQKAIRIPLYDAEVEHFDAKDQNHWIGAADIKLEGRQLEAETPVDISVSIDDDGCLDVEAVVQDGSELRQRVFISPEMVDSPENIEIPDSTKTATFMPDWKKGLSVQLLFAQCAVEIYDEFLKPQDLAELKKLSEEGHEAIVQENEQKGKEVDDRIGAILQEQLNGWFILLIMGALYSRSPQLEPRQKSEIESLIREIVDGLRSQRPPATVIDKLRALDQLLKNIQDSDQLSLQDADDTWLKKA